MQASELPLAVAAAMWTASSLDLTVDDAVVLHDSNSSLCVSCLVTRSRGWHL